MRFLVISVLVASALAGARLPAQEVVRRVDSRADRLAIEANIFRALFDGIVLTPEQAAKAREVIALENGAQLELQRGDPNLWDKRKRLNFVRDSTLRLLLTRPEDRQRFDRQAEKLRPQGELPRRSP